MLRNYLRVAFRGLLRNRFSAFVNIGGLAIGMAVALLIGLWIQDELSYDQYHAHYDRIVQVLQKEKFLGKTEVWEHQPFLLLDALRTGYSAPFERIVASVPAEGLLLSVGASAGRAEGAGAVAPASGAGPANGVGSLDEKKMPIRGLFMDADGPDMLTLKMLKGSRSGLAGDLHSILLSASVARGLVRRWRSARGNGSRWTTSGIRAIKCRWS